MLLLGKMILAEAKSAVQAAPQGLFAALMATARGGNRAMNVLDFTGILHAVPSFDPSVSSE